MKKKVLVLGATGMAGHVVFTYLDSLQKYELSNIVFRKKLNENSVVADVTKKEQLIEVIDKIQPDILINCVGVLIKGSILNPANAIYINSYLPHLLSAILEQTNSRLIHISTDCVFSGEKGSYNENDFKDAKDIYGKSKSLGEVINDRDLTIRTSIIGPELKNAGEGLIHWLLKQSGIINGFSKSIWSGVTTLQLAKAIDSSIDSRTTGLYNLTNGTKISKFDLLALIKKVFSLDIITINETEGKNVDKSLVDNRKEKKMFVPTYEDMLLDLYQFMQNHHYYYKHYNLF